MRNIFARVRQPSLRQGLIFGLILEVIQFILIFASGLLSGMDSIISLALLALFAIFAYMAGQRAAQETGKLSTGVLAGLFTGIIGYVLIGIATLVQAVIFLQQYVNYATTHPAPGAKPSDYTSSSVLTGIVINLLGGLIFYALISMIGGTIGGLVGRRRANTTESEEEYKEALFVPPSTD